MSEDAAHEDGWRTTQPPSESAEAEMLKIRQSDVPISEYERDRILEVVKKLVTDHEQRIASNERAIATMVQTSVTNGIKQAVADQATWDAFFGALTTRAQDSAGIAAFAGIKWLLSRVFWLLVIGGVLYAAGGWSLLVTVFKASTTKVP